MPKKGTYQLLVVFAMLSVVGLVLLPRLPVRLNPDSQMATFRLSFAWPGAEPYLIEQQITSLLEGSLSGINGLKQISSVSRSGAGEIELRFDSKADLSMLRFEIISIVRRIYPMLPEGISFPAVRPVYVQSESGKALLTYTLDGPISSGQLQSMVESQLKMPLLGIEGIENVNVFGGEEKSWVVRVSLSDISRWGLTEEGLMSNLREQLGVQPLGKTVLLASATPDSVSIPVILSGQGSEDPDWGSVYLVNNNGRLVKLIDIATISYESVQQNSFFRINGRNAVSMMIFVSPGSNALRVAKMVQQTLESVRPQLPDEVVLRLSYDGSRFIKEELRIILRRTLLTLTILLLFVALMRRSIRHTVAVGLGLIVNLCVSIIFFYLFRFEMHLVSLAAITISLGLIIDNTIVVVDHLLYRKNLLIIRSLLAATLTSVMALLAILFLPEKIKVNLFDFVGVVAVSLLVSLAVSMLFIPSLLSRWQLKAPQNNFSVVRRRRQAILSQHYVRYLHFASVHRVWIIATFVLALGLPVHMLPAALEGEGWAVSFYNKTIGSAVYQQYLRPWADRLLGGSLRLFSKYVFEQSQYSAREETVLRVEASLPQGYTSAHMDELMKGIEAKLLNVAGIDMFSTWIQGPTFATISIYFKPEAENSFIPLRIRSGLISHSLKHTAVSWNIYGLGKGYSQSSVATETINYKLQLEGYTLDLVESFAERAGQLLSEHPRVLSVNASGSKSWWESTPVFEYFLVPKPEMLAMHQTNMRQFFYRAALYDLQGGTNSIIPTRYAPIKLKFINADHESSGLWHLMQEPGPNNEPALKHLSHGIDKRPAPREIIKENQNYIRYINYQFVGSPKQGDHLLHEVAEKIQASLPLGFRIKPIQLQQISGDEKANYSLIVLLIVFSIFIISAALFESLLKPLAVIAFIPLSFTGVFLTFYLFDIHFDQGGYASMLLLSGLVVNAAIYIINDYTHFSTKGYKAIRAYLKAFNGKIGAVVATILSTVLGLIPIFIDGQSQAFWFALAAGASGGLIFSLLIIFFLLPALVLPGKPKMQNQPISEG
ncbi:MAG TPA: efflux RND transporter permease subunit [Bacteroidales bacterium]|nr:efflux RND transporter permease subunit [Bacteroidales bacterium]